MDKEQKCSPVLPVSMLMCLLLIICQAHRDDCKIVHFFAFLWWNLCGHDLLPLFMHHQILFASVFLKISALFSMYWGYVCPPPPCVCTYVWNGEERTDQSLAQFFRILPIWVSSEGFLTGLECSPGSACVCHSALRWQALLSHLFSFFLFS